MHKHAQMYATADVDDGSTVTLKQLTDKPPSAFYQTSAASGSINTRQPSDGSKANLYVPDSDNDEPQRMYSAKTPFARTDARQSGKTAMTCTQKCT
jgi:hypothetical protein